MKRTPLSRRGPNWERKHAAYLATKREKAKRRGPQPKMSDERLKCGERAQFRCERCSKYAPPEGPWWIRGQAHHVQYRSHGGEDHHRNLEWLCPEHHREIHDGAKPVPRKERNGDIQRG